VHDFATDEDQPSERVTVNSGRVSSRHDHATSLLRTAGRDSTRGGHNASLDLFISNRSKHREIQIGLPLKYDVFTTVAFLPTAQKSSKGRYGYYHHAIRFNLSPP
jgi:hypothetical protein